MNETCSEEYKYSIYIYRERERGRERAHLMTTSNSPDVSHLPVHADNPQSNKFKAMVV